MSFENNPARVPASVNTAATIRLQSSKLIIVEGKDEETCFNYWLKCWGLAGIQVAPIGGKSQIANTIGILRLLPGFLQLSHLLIVRDADDTPTGAFDSVSSALTQAQFAVPVTAWNWQASPNQDPALCIAILPSIPQKGALEELLLQTVADDEVLSLTEKYIAEAYEVRRANYEANSANSIVPPSEVHRGKATALAYMVTRIADMREVGRAAQKDVWDLGLETSGARTLEKHHRTNECVI